MLFDNLFTVYKPRAPDVRLRRKNLERGRPTTAAFFNVYVVLKNSTRRCMSGRRKRGRITAKAGMAISQNLDTNKQLAKDGNATNAQEI